MSIFDADPVFKPFRYPWAYEAWLQQQKIHWLPEEVPMAEDIKDWKTKVTDSERNLLTQVFRFFTQGDIEIEGVYLKYYTKVFKPNEIVMMLTSFANTETIHIVGYAHLIDTLGLPESEYSAFLKYKEMKDKYDYFQTFSIDNKHEIAKSMAAFSGFVEGMQLFSSFAILLNFPRLNKLKGMGQIISWSVRDESLHCLSIAKLFRTMIHEFPELWTPKLKADVLEICETMIAHEDAFIDLAFGLGPIEGLSADEVKQYIRFIADRRLVQLGFEEHYRIERNPLPWVDEMVNAVEMTNFFENRATEYSKAATSGDWEDAF